MAIKLLSSTKIGNFTLPHTDGVSGQALVTDGNGNISFAHTGGMSGLSFSSGVLTATTASGNITVNLDGRYALSSHTHAYDNYQSWNLKTNGVQRTTVQSGGTLDLVAGSNVTLSYGAGGVVTIAAGSSSGTVTSVSGTGTVSGLTLSGTVTSSGSLTLGGTLTLTSAQVTAALGFTPYNSTNPNGYITSSGSISGNAATTTTLQTARTINGTSFNGSANIETSYWGSTRTITIGATGKSVNGSGNISWTLGEIQAEYEVPLNTLRNNLGSPTVREAALFHGQFNNKFRFLVPTLQEESTDGTTWTTSTRASAANLGDMMIGEGQGTSFSAIPGGTIGTYGAYRLTWDVVGSTGYVFLNALYIFNSTNGNTVNITIEARHNTNGWQTITGPHATSNWPGHAYIPHSNIPYSTNPSQYSQVRITFTTTHNTNTNAFTIYGIEWFGGYPQGRRNVESYDRDRNVYFPAAIQGTRLISTVGTGTAPLSVSSTTVVTNLNADMVDGYHSSSLWRSDGGVWNPGANITLGQTANNQEWSFDISRNGYTGGYWHVWDSALSTMLKVDPNNGKVYAPYNFVGNLEGNSTTATTLQTARTFTIGNTGKTFNGSGDVSWTLAEIGAQAAGSYAAASHTHVWTDITNRPTTVSSFTNDSGYITSSGSISGYSTNLISQDIRTLSPSSHSAYRLNFGFTSWANNNSSPYADYLHLRSYSDSSGGSDNLIMFKKSGIGMRIWQQAFGSTTAYATYADVWTSNDFTSSNVTNWNTAYGWGNHASAGYLTSASLSGYATQAYVNTAVANVVNSAPAALDTLNELAAALGNDANYSTTISTALGNRLRVDTAAQGLTGIQQSNARTNLGLGTAATSNTGDFATSGHSHSNATTAAAGFMSAADKSKLDGIASGATANAGTVTSVSGTGSYGGLTLSGTVTSSGSLTLGGTPTGTWPISVSGNAATASSTPLISSSGAFTTQHGDGRIGYTYALTNPQTGLFPASDNANAILTVNRHPGNYYSQLGFSSNGNLYYRNFVNTAINTSQGWQTIWTSSSLTNLNQLSNGPGYTSNTGTVTSVSGTGTVSGLTLSGTVTTSGSLTLSGTLTLTSGQVTTALGYTPYNSSNPNGYITSSGSVAQLSGWSLQNIVPYHSGSDFPNGTLVVTNINASVTSGDSFVMEVTGKSYQTGNSPFSLILQGYIYADTFINCSAMNNGTTFPNVVILNYGGNLAFWWPRISYWNSFSVSVREAGGSSSNRVTSISDSTEPASSKKVTVTPINVIHSNNIGSQSVNYAASAGSVAWGNVSGRPTTVSSFTNDSGYITSGGRAYPRRSDGGDLNFYWSGQSGQPTWLWGGTDGANMYVYNPSNFSVNYANTAGSAPANGGNSNTVAGLSVHSARNNEANKIVRTDANGYIQAGWINTPSGAFTSAITKIYCSDDDYVRYQTPASFISNLGLITTSNIGSQSVNYASSAGSVAWGNVSGKPSLATPRGEGTNYIDYARYVYNNGAYSGSGWIEPSDLGVRYAASSNYATSSGSSGSTSAINSTGWGNGNFTWYQTPGGLAPYTGSWASFLVSNHGDGSNYYNQTIIMPFWGPPQYSRREGGTNRGPYTFWSTENLDPNNISGNLSVSGSITAGGDVTAYSDARIKTEVKTVEDALDKVLALRGVTYKRTDIEDKSTKIGVIAQEVKEVLPEVVSEKEDGMLAVSYGNMVGVLIEAMKEQQAMIETLEAKIELLTRYLK